MVCHLEPIVYLHSCVFLSPLVYSRASRNTGSPLSGRYSCAHKCCHCMCAHCLGLKGIQPTLKAYLNPDFLYLSDVCVLTAAQLIRLVPAVIVLIAGVLQRNTLSITAFVLFV